MRNLLAYAQGYAGRGWRLVPLHTPNGSRCDCGRQSCRLPDPGESTSMGKHPRITKWTENASNDFDEVTRWWSQWPSANIGLATGRASGVVVMDVDPRNGGLDEILRLSAEHGWEHDGPIVATGGGGWHYFFAAPEQPITNNHPFPGIDIQADGQQVVLPPSVHYTGVGYEWTENGPDVPLPEMPEWLLAACSTRPLRAKSGGVATLLPRGGRNAGLASFGGSLRAKGASEHVIFAALMAYNDEVCDPPLDRTEVAQIAASVSRYEPSEGVPVLGSAPAAAREPRKRAHIEPFTINMRELQQRVFPPPKYAVPGLMPTGLCLLAGRLKMGKAQPLTERVLTPAGWRAMGVLRVGDQVIGSNGLPTEVIAVHPQGVQPIYRLTFSDGTSVRATDDHLWAVQTKNDLRRHREGTVRETRNIRAAVSRGDKLYVPLVAPVRFDAMTELPIDPYALGLLIGDGGLTRGVTLTAPAARTMPCRPDHKSPKKFIPPQYLRSSVMDRWALLQGLMDTDGGVEMGAAVFSTSSPQLAADVKELVETLGGTAKTSIKMAPAYTHNGERRIGLPCYRIRVRLPQFGCPFRLPRKAMSWHAGAETRRPIRRRIVSVAKEGQLDAQCITVAAPDGLYVTEGCVLTHNSWLMLGTGIAIAEGGIALGSIPVDDGDVLYIAYEDHDRRLQHRAITLLGDAPWPERMEVAPSGCWPKREDGGLEAIDAWLGAHPDARMVVIDTLQRFRGGDAGEGDKNAYAADYNVSAELQELAMRHEVVIVAVHHFRKSLSETDWVDQISGTNGIAGAADSILGFLRNRGEKDAILLVTGRDVDEQELALEFDPEKYGWFVSGTAEDARLRAGGAEFRQAMWEIGKGHAVHFHKIAEVLGKKRNTVYQMGKRLSQKGMIQSLGNGLFGPVGHKADAEGGMNVTDVTVDSGRM